MHDGNKTVLRAFDFYFVAEVAQVIPLSRTVIEKATDVRARYNFKTPDSIHVAAAIHWQCDVFLTNDKQLQRCQEIQVVTIADLQSMYEQEEP